MDISMLLWIASVRIHGVIRLNIQLGTASNVQKESLGLQMKRVFLLPLYFNAGMFVFEPSRITCTSLIESLMVTSPTPFAEQDFLNKYFEKIYKPIPLMYNLVLAMLWRHPENLELEKVKVVHYCAAVSPLFLYLQYIWLPKAEMLDWRNWSLTSKGYEANMEREDIKMLVAKWRDIYNDRSLEFKTET